MVTDEEIAETVVGIQSQPTSFDPSWHSVDLTGSSSSSSSSGNSEKRASSPVDDEITFFVENDPSVVCVI